MNTVSASTGFFVCLFVCLFVVLFCFIFYSYTHISGSFKGCGMGPWLVLISPCFRENEVATCKIGSFFV